MERTVTGICPKTNTKKQITILYRISDIDGTSGVPVRDGYICPELQNGACSNHTQCPIYLDYFSRK